MVRPLQFGIVGIVPGRVRGDEAAVHAADWAEQFLTPEFFRNVPFHSVSLIIVYGPNTDLQTDFQRCRHDELPVSVQLDLTKLRRINRDVLENAFRYVILKVLLDVAAKFRLPGTQLEQELARLEAPDV